jgi:hypothetical protein
MEERSITSPSSTKHNPGALWPPPLTARSISFSRAKFTQLITSATSAQRTIMRGYLSIMAL